MQEYRADGSTEGEPTMGRIYVMASKGELHYSSHEVELVSDWPKYIEQYSTFRGFCTGFLPMDELEKAHQELIAAGFLQEDKDREKVAYLKEEFMKARDVAEKAAHAYFAACPVGPERIRASDIYENIRNSTRV